MKIFYVIILVLLSTSLYSQISTSFSFGSLGAENGSSNVYTGPVVIDGANECMTLQNGINLLVKENEKGLFRLGCSTKDMNEAISFIIFPNPSTDFIVLKAGQKNFVGNRFDVDILDVRGANLFQKTITLTELIRGYRIDLGGVANGFYLVKLYADKQLHTFKFIKTGNLR
jgi:hypothetical protein